MSLVAEPHLSHPGEVSWFAGYGPVPIAGLCPHDCQHQDAKSVAWGPDWEHYILEQCVHCGCRGWYGEWEDAEGRRHYRFPDLWLQPLSDPPSGPGFSLVESSPSEVTFELSADTARIDAALARGRRIDPRRSQ